MTFCAHVYHLLLSLLPFRFLHSYLPHTLACPSHDVKDVTSAGPSKTKTKSSVPRKQSGYQVYVAEVMKGGMKMGEAAATWKTMAAEEQQKYKDAAASTFEGIIKDCMYHYRMCVLVCVYVHVCVCLYVCMHVRGSERV